MTTWTTEDREALEKGLEFFKELKGNNSSPPHIVDSGASVKTLADYIEQENREEMLRNQLHLLQNKIKELEAEAFCLRKQMEQLLSERW
jgi:hypothetical protein